MKTPLIVRRKAQQPARSIFLCAFLASFALFLLHYFSTVRVSEYALGVRDGKQPFNANQNEGTTSQPLPIASDPNLPQYTTHNLPNPVIQPPQNPIDPNAQPRPAFALPPLSHSDILSAIQEVEHGLPQPPSHAIRPIPFRSTFGVPQANPSPSQRALPRAQYVYQVYPDQMSGGKMGGKNGGNMGGKMGGKAGGKMMGGKGGKMMGGKGGKMMGGKGGKIGGMVQQVHHVNPPAGGTLGMPIVVFPSAQEPLQHLPQQLHVNPPVGGALGMPIVALPSAQEPLQHLPQQRENVYLRTLQNLSPYQLEQIQRFQTPPHLWHLLQPQVHTTRAPSTSPTFQDSSPPNLRQNSPLMPEAGSSEHDALQGLLTLDYPSTMVEGAHVEPPEPPSEPNESDGSSQYTLDGSEDLPPPVVALSTLLRMTTGARAARGRGGRSRGRQTRGRMKGSGLKQADEKVANADELRVALDQVLGNIYPEPDENLQSFQIRVIDAMRVYLKGWKLMFYQNLMARIWFQDQVAIVYNVYKERIRGQSAGAGSSSRDK